MPEVRIKDIVMVPVSKLVAHPKNPNKHPADQIERLADIIEFQGWRYPVKVSNRSGFVTSGHGRIEAAKLRKWTEVPVSYQDYESEAQEYADVVSDNAIAEWSDLDLSSINKDIGELGPDLDIDLLGIKDFVLEPAEKFQPGCDEDDVPDAGHTRVKPGDRWLLGDHVLMCGDSTKDFVELLNGVEPDFCFTSPPYSDQRDYSGQLELEPKHLAKCLMAPAKLFAVNLGLQRKSGAVFPYWNEWLEVASEIGLKLLSWNVWDKLEAGSIGNNSAMFPIEHEWIFVFGQKTELNKTLPTKWAGTVKTHLQGARDKDGTLHYKDKLGKVGTLKKLSTVYRGSPEKARNFDHDHPAMFPVHFPESYILACTDEGESVYEPFSGSGTTIIACEKTKRRCFAMEIDPHYCDIIIARWEKYTGRKAELQASGPAQTDESTPA